MDGKEQNGGGQVAHEKAHFSQIILSLDVHPWNLHIGGDIESNDCAIAMLQQALRYFEAKSRQAFALQFAAQLEEQKRTAAMAAQIRGRA